MKTLIPRILILGLFVLINYFSGSAQSVTTTIGNVTGCQGDTISIPVNVSMTGSGVSAISMAINFDSTKLQCLGGAQSLHPSFSTGSLTNCVSVPGVGKQIRFVWSDLNPRTLSGQLFVLKFRILSGGYHIVDWDLTPGLCEYANQFGQVISNSTWSFGTISCNSNPINVSLGSANGCNGDTLSIPVSILNANNIGAISLALKYNPNSTTFLGVTGIDPMISTLIASTNNFGGFNQIRASWAEVTPVNLNGIAFYIRVIVNNNDNLSFDLTNTGNTEISDPLGNPYTNVTYSGTNTSVTASTTNTTNATACSTYLWSVNNHPTLHRGLIPLGQVATKRSLI
ncbi:MAG: cohesin domain-containing protein [Bacteroidota bacterium]